MKLFSGNRLIAGTTICTAILLSGIASAMKPEQPGSDARKVNNVEEHQVVYTASGTTDMRTARLFQKLMQNKSNLKVEAIVSHPVKKVSRPAVVNRTMKRPVEVSVNYTVHGKTDMQTVKKLMKLFKSNQEVEVIARADVRVNPEIARVNYGNGKQRYAYRQSQPRYTYQPHNAYRARYQPAYANSYTQPSYYYNVNSKDNANDNANWQKPAAADSYKQSKLNRQNHLASTYYPHYYYPGS